ncbi:MAG TPA: hypothetical protein VKP11_06020 [Frankiaceae bacterium]|nr:hypothetical protein [Frankiaceae bacterium]
MGAELRSRVQVERAVLLARVNAARHVVAQMTTEGLPGCVVRQARDEEARCWSVYRRVVRG